MKEADKQSQQVVGPGSRQARGERERERQPKVSWPSDLVANTPTSIMSSTQLSLAGKSCYIIAQLWRWLAANWRSRRPSKDELR